MTELFLDFETKSLLDLNDVGRYNYVHHPSTSPLMLGWAFDDEPVQLWQQHENPDLPARVLDALCSPEVLKIAWHAPFEKDVLSVCFGIDIPLEQWADPNILCRYLSAAGDLREAGEIFNIPPELRKLDKGLLKKFCAPIPPRKPRKKKVNSAQNALFFDIGSLPEGSLPTVPAPPELPIPPAPPKFRDHATHPKEWAVFCDYCKNDVEAERALWRIVQPFQLPAIEVRGYALDQKINNTGMPANLELAKKALRLAERSKEDLGKQIIAMTGVENPNSQPKMLDWLNQHGYEYNSLNKDFVSLALKDSGSPMDEECKTVLKLRQEGSKTAHTKLEALVNKISADGTLKNQFAFLAAGRTGRWAGEAVQLQNLPRPIREIKDMHAALALIEAEAYDTIRGTYPSVLGFITSCIRSIFQAPPGSNLAVCDLNAIENRGLGWVAGCEAILDVFRNHRDPYVDFATKMYGQPYDILKKDKDKRQVAKPAVLGCGYGLGPGVKEKGGEYEILWKTNKAGDEVKTGLLAYAERMGIMLTPEQAWKSVKSFRSAYPEVVRFWDNIELCVAGTIRDGRARELGFLKFDLVFLTDKTKILRIHLPSGRCLHYINARLETREVQTRNGPEQRPAIYYDGIGHGVAHDGPPTWGPVYTYGGKLTENVVQAISRDLLLHAMLLADAEGLRVVGHVHDEIITLIPDAPEFAFALPDLQRCMSTTPIWAPGLPLGAEGYVDTIYKKG